MPAEIAPSVLAMRGAFFIDSMAWLTRRQIDVREPLKELEQTKDAYISYAVVGSTSLPMYTSKSFATRRRYHDFTFLHDHLAKDFPACVVPPLPGKHRMGASALA